MIKQFRYINLEYTDKDNLYIEKLVSYIRYNINEIIDFFQIDGFDQKINIKIFSELKEFRVECSKK